MEEREGALVERLKRLAPTPELALERLGYRFADEDSLDVKWTAAAQIALALADRLSPRVPLVDAPATAIANTIIESQHILVLSGAAASHSSLFPTFSLVRGKGGVSRPSSSATEYAELVEIFGLEGAAEIFEAPRFVRTQQPLYQAALRISTGNYAPTPSHHFVRALDEAEKLLRNYTANIDGLEEVAGIRYVQPIYGSLRECACTLCGTRADMRDMLAAMKIAKVLRCARCTQGVNFVKPSVRLLGEWTPTDELTAALEHDIPRVDFVVLLGAPGEYTLLQRLLRAIPASVPRALLGCPAGSDDAQELKEMFDMVCYGGCDEAVASVARVLGWELPGGGGGGALSQQGQPPPASVNPCAQTPSGLTPLAWERHDKVDSASLSVIAKLQPESRLESRTRPVARPSGRASLTKDVH